MNTLYGMLVFVQRFVLLYFAFFQDCITAKTWLISCDCLLNPFSTNVPLMQKLVSCFLLAKCLRNTCGRVTFLVNMQVDDLHLYLKCHSSTDVFQTFYRQKPTTWFILKWNIGRNGSIVFLEIDRYHRFTGCWQDYFCVKKMPE